MNQNAISGNFQPSSVILCDTLLKLYHWDTQNDCNEEINERSSLTERTATNEKHTKEKNIEIQNS